MDKPEDIRLYMERAAEVLKKVYVKHKKSLPKSQDNIREFEEFRKHPEEIAKKFDMNAKEVLKVLQEELVRKKRK